MTTTISIRTNLELKNKAAKIFEARGLNMSTAFNMYLSDVVEGRTAPVSDALYIIKKNRTLKNLSRKNIENSYALAIKEKKEKKLISVRDFLITL